MVHDCDERTATRKLGHGRKAENGGKNGKCRGQRIANLFHKIALFAIIHGMATTTHKEVSEDTLEKLLYLSRLSPESTDMATLKKQVDDIVGYFDILSKYDDSENPYDAYPSTDAEKLRDDTVVPGLEMSDVKKINAANFMDGYFQVPKVLGEGA